MFDIIITNANIYDGTGKKPYCADIGIKDGKILEIGALKESFCSEVIDAKGLCVFPGFIDSHTHSDIALLNNPERKEALLQGITTEVISACGIGCVPLSENKNEYIKTVKAIMGESEKDFNSSSVSAYMNELEKNGTGVNVAIQLAHSPLRIEATGFSDTPLKGKNLEKCLELADKAFSEGACAFTTGLSYYPAAFSDTDEIVEICKVAAKYDVPICVHQRTALRNPKLPFDPKEEVLDFARKSGVRIHYSHFRTTPKTAGSLDKLLEPIERGLAEGLKITADFYPYPVGSGYLPVYLPFGVMDCNLNGILEKLKSEAVFKEFIKNAMQTPDAVITETSFNKDYLGKSFLQIAKEENRNVEDVMYKLLCDEKLNVGYRLNAEFDKDDIEKLEKDFVSLIKKPYYMVGSDTLPLNSNPHPRSYGAFSKMIRIAKKHGIELELLANRMCKNPAELFKLKNRGSIEKGNYADIIIFDPNEFSDISTFENPKQYANGMKYVIVNGKLAVKEGKLSAVLGGKPLKSEK